MANPKAKGRWKKGQSGNPSGRPKKDVDLAKAAREYTQEALETIYNIMLSGKYNSDRLKAATILLDRGYGRAPETIQITGAEGGPVEFVERPKRVTLEEWQTHYTQNQTNRIN